MKNTSLEGKDAAIISILQRHFKGEINLARVKLISLFIVALCKVRSVNYEKLSATFDVNASKLSSYRRIQRFMANFDLPMRIISKLIFALLPDQDKLTLSVDRTNWKFGKKNINIW